jgi:copper chaperone CopZ
MSGFKKNYDKVMLGAGFATLAGVIAAAVSGGAKIEPAPGKVKESEVYPWEGVLAKMKEDNAKLSNPAGQQVKVWDSVKLNANQVARLFQGPSLVQKANEDTTFDALAPDAAPIRGNIPNSWFIQNGLDITRSKILKRDDDSDKYSNEEEFLGGSNPRDPNSTPSAVLKLKLVEIAGLKSELKFTVSGNEYQIRRVREETAGKEETKSNLNAKIGEQIFADPRFKLEGVQDQTVDGKPIKVAQISDSMVKAGSPFMVKDRETVNRPIQTAKVLCNLDGVEELVVKEGESLSFKAFPSIKFKLVKIDPAAQAIEVEYAEGGNASKTQQIKKD